MASTRDGGFTRTLTSNLIEFEKNEIVVSAWKILGDKYFLAMLIESKEDAILLSCIKNRGEHYQFTCENIKDVNEKKPLGDRMFLYSFHTLDPSSLRNYPKSLSEKNPVNEVNPEKFLLMQAWDCLAACGMNKLVCIQDTPSPKLFSYAKNPKAVRPVKSTCFDSMENFGSSKIGYFSCFNFSEGVPELHSLLGNAKLAEFSIVKLDIHQETNIKYRPGKEGCCSIT